MSAHRFGIHIGCDNVFLGHGIERMVVVLVGFLDRQPAICIAPKLTRNPEDYSRVHLTNYASPVIIPPYKE